MRRPHSSYQKVVQGKCPLNFLHFNGAVCSNTLFSNTSALSNSLLFSANSTCKGSRTPRLVEHFWVPILGAACSNELFVGTLRPSHRTKNRRKSKGVRERGLKLSIVFLRIAIPAAIYRSAPGPGPESAPRSAF